MLQHVIAFEELGLKLLILLIDVMSLAFVEHTACVRGDWSF